jgi:putative membrane-bound dehydrogenase-like protein
VRTSSWLPFWLACCALLAAHRQTPAADTRPDTHVVGVARIDITPKYPIRLSGFGFRRAESEGVTQRIWARALAIGQDDPAVLVAVDNLGVPATLVEELARRLASKGVQRDRLAVTATHTHTAPMLSGVCPTLFGMPIPKEHQEHIDRYTREFTDNLEKVALAALADRRPARLSWGIGKVSFAVNRRTRGGPVDHDLPVLVVRAPEGNVRAVWVNYACHCVTLSHNKISGDWAGYAGQAIEDDHKGAIALVSIGCGADSNPSSGVTGDKVEIASRQGMEVAREVKRLLGGYLAPVTGPLTAAATRLDLPLADLPTKEQWEKLAVRKDAIGHHARVQLDRLGADQKLRTAIDYRVVTWSFGSLGIVFLPGEVVVDYALRLKKELDGQRLWINAYSNDAPCYIPSERVLKEGGYEGGGAMIYYDVPAPFRPGLEQKIVAAVIGQLGKDLAPAIDPRRTGGSLPRSPQQSLACLRVRDGLTVDLVAAEPLLASPVAIDFGPDGKLWVAEMLDYPAGVKGDFKPGGRIRVLEDTDGDGIYDKATVFLDNIPFPTGLTVWRRGVLICAAPDILYAEDTDGDGRADVVRKLYSGFGTDNYQARVNSLAYGLDGWVHGSCGLFGGRITSHLTGKVLDLGNRDFRIQPDTGAIEPATGRTQQGRVRDDRGNWFGCDNSTLARHLVLPDHYLRRNPHVAFPDTISYVPDYPDSTRLFPVGDLQLFKLSGPAGRVTSACGIGVYRDELLGKDCTGNLFTCEPVNLLVHRLTLSPRGSTFSGRRAAEEKDREFLASTDGWFRPVQVRTGPDGALWVVDMYRFVIEHPRWIPREDLARLDVRAGAGLGRIYRIRPSDQPLRKVPRLDRLSTDGLVAALDTANGTVRDLAGQMLLWKKEAGAGPALEKLALGSSHPEARLQALCVLAGLGKLTPDLVEKGLADRDAGVRRHSIRLAEPFLSSLAPGSALAKLREDPDAQVRLQLAFSLGEWRDRRSGALLADLATKYPDDPHLLAAALSSVHADNLGAILSGVLAHRAPPEGLRQKLLSVAMALGEKEKLAKVLGEVAALREGKAESWQFAALAAMLEALERRKLALASLGDEGVIRQVKVLVEQARRLAVEEKAADAERISALSLLGRGGGKSADSERVLLGKLLVPQTSPAVQSAALAALGRIPEESVAATVLAGWKGYSPGLRGQVLDLLLSREIWLEKLLAALEKKELAPGQIDLVRRRRLLQHRDGAIQKRAARVFADATSPDRDKVVKEYAAALSLKGDRVRGKAVFGKSCATCHRLEGVGHEVGPDLAALANKSPQYLLNEILDPNRNLDTRYIQYLATTRRGLTYTGLLLEDTATSITLRQPEGKVQVVLRADLEELRSSGQSLMPEGLEKDLTKQDVADLIAYLGSQGKPARRFPGNQPVNVKVVAGGCALLATTCEIHGGDICFEAPFGNVGCWHGTDDHILWTVEVEKEATFDVWLDYSCADAVAGNRFVLEGGKGPLRGAVSGTGGWDRYQQKKVGQVTLEAGVRQVVVRPEGMLKGALLDLRGVYLVRPGEKPRFGTREGTRPPPG